MMTKTVRDMRAILRADYALVRQWRQQVDGWTDDLLRAEDERTERALNGNCEPTLKLRSITFSQLAEPIRRHLAAHDAPACMRRAA